MGERETTDEQVADSSAYWRRVRGTDVPHLPRGVSRTPPSVEGSFSTTPPVVPRRRGWFPTFIESSLPEGDKD